MSLKELINLRFVLKSLAVLFVGFLVISLFRSTRPSTPEYTLPEYTLDGDEVLLLINIYRSDTGKEEFEKSERLCDWGKIRLYEVKRDWSHRGFSADRVCDTDKEKCILGENLAMMQTNSSDTVAAWINSPKHKQILDINYEMACVITENGYAVAEFASFTSK